MRWTTSRFTDSQTQPPPNGFPWDAYHINSLQLTDDGKALVSMRNTSAGYLFDVETGKFEWQLGGKHSTFDIAPDAQFEWQHDLQLQDDSTLTLFDNHCCEITGAGEYLPSDRGSRALRLKLDTAKRTATVSEAFSHGDGFRSQYMGNTQILDNGNVFVGWGQVPFISEFDATGKLIFDAAFPGLEHQLPDVGPAVGRSAAGQATGRHRESRAGRPPSSRAGTARPR